MPQILTYNRSAAAAYAKKWAFDRNPAYFDFSKLGGDCTNFISQCLYAGSRVQNYTPVYGWYYNSPEDRSPSWTGVEYLYNFLTTNQTRAVFAQDTTAADMQIGDVIQLGDENGHYYHSLLVTKISGAPREDTIFVTTHTFNAYMRRLSSYTYANARFLHILGVYV